MYLFLDPRSLDKIIVGLWDGGSGELLFETHERDRGALLVSVDAMLKKKQYKAHALSGIVVVPGPGGFSNVRGAIVLTNVFQFANKTPTISIIPLEGENQISVFRKGIALLASESSHSKSHYLSPAYGAEPNITKPKI